MNDSILPSILSSYQLINPKDFTNGSRLARFGERVWVVVAFLLFTTCFLIMAIGYKPIYKSVVGIGGWQGLLAAVGVVGLFLYSLYVGLALAGYLRWMSKTKVK